MNVLEGKVALVAVLMLLASAPAQAEFGDAAALAIDASNEGDDPEDWGDLDDWEDSDDEANGSRVDADFDPIMDVLGPCVRGTEPHREAEALLTTLVQAQRKLEPSGSTKAFSKALEALRHHDCFRWPTGGWPDDEKADALQLREWWSAGGERWLRTFLEYGPQHRRVALAPDLRGRLGQKSRRLLSTALCDPKRSTCAAGDSWRARATAALQAASCSEPPQPCAVSEGPPPESEWARIGWQYRKWIRCSEERLGRAMELPLDPVNPPEDGWLVVRDRRGEGAAASCRIAAAYSLATGDAWRVDSCGSVRTRVGRVPLAPLRELALLLAVSDDIEYSVRASGIELELPKGLEPGWTNGYVEGVVGGLIGCRVGGFIPRVSYRISIGDIELPGEFFTDRCYAFANVASQWLQDLDRKWVKACPTAKFPERLFARPDLEPPSAPEPKDRERRTYQELEALMRAQPEGCAKAAEQKR